MHVVQDRSRTLREGKAEHLSPAMG